MGVGNIRPFRGWLRLLGPARAPVWSRPKRHRSVMADCAIEELEARTLFSAGPLGPTLDFASGFAGSSGVLTYNGSATIHGTSAQLTDGGKYEAGSVFSTNAVDVSRFSNQFTFQLTNANADGFTFTIQGNGPTALGPAGGGLGYGPDTPGHPPGIPSSLAVKFDLYNNAGEGTDSTGEYTDGASPTVPAIDLSNSGIDLHSGEVFQVTMTYDGTTLDVTITDTSTQASTTQSYAVNIPQVIGSDTGYVGFTGGTGAQTAVQDILTWSYTPPPAAPTSLTATRITTTEVDLHWKNVATDATGIEILRQLGNNSPQVVATSLPPTTNSYSITGLLPGSPYTFEVVAIDSSGPSGTARLSVDTLPTPMTGFNRLVLAISPGGPGAGAFVADTDFHGGTISVGTHANINSSAISNPPPQSVLQHGRYGDFTYTISHLTAGASYAVRLDFVEYIFDAAGARVFNVAINGTQVLRNFDIWSEAGGENIALAETFAARASARGTITITFTSVVNNSMVNGIEIYGPGQDEGNGKNPGGGKPSGQGSNTDGGQGDGPSGDGSGSSPTRTGSGSGSTNGDRGSSPPVTTGTVSPNGDTGAVSGSGASPPAIHFEGAGSTGPGGQPNSFRHDNAIGSSSAASSGGDAPGSGSSADSGESGPSSHAHAAARGKSPNNRPTATTPQITAAGRPFRPASQAADQLFAGAVQLPALDFGKLGQALDALGNQLDSATRSHSQEIALAAALSAAASVGYTVWSVNQSRLAQAALGGAPLAFAFDQFDPLAYLDAWERSRR
jgi:Malectin domain/Legume lectin domain/Fibronectin type III domain